VNSFTLVMSQTARSKYSKKRKNGQQPMVTKRRTFIKNRYPKGLKQQLNLAVTALCGYLEKQKNSGSDLLWDDEMDINFVAEPKVITKRNRIFNSIRIPLAHSFRLKTPNEICIITRNQDEARWKQVLLEEHPVSGLTKVMSLKTFERTFREDEDLKNLVEVFDLFILHPDVRYKVMPRMAVLLRDQNKSCGILPNDWRLLQLGGAVNPLDSSKSEMPGNGRALSPQKKKFAAANLARLVASYRDSTFTNNIYTKQRFIKIAESGMSPKKIRENALSVWDYGLCLLPNGGRENVVRASLHIENTTIQLPFYANLDPLDSWYSVVLSRPQEQDEYIGMGKAPRTEKEQRNYLEDGKDEMFKAVLTDKRRCPLLIKNMKRTSYSTHCRERESESEVSSESDMDLKDPSEL